MEFQNHPSQTATLGPQVSNSTSLTCSHPPAHPQVLQLHMSAVTPDSAPTVPCRMTPSGPPGNHIYMEVDPFYTGEGEPHHCSSLASSNSSQTSSGYSTAPSDHMK